MHTIIINRIYDEPSSNDGYRILVDRLWPCGISKKDANLDEWNKEIAPSTALRKWFNHKEERFDGFAQRYREELSDKVAELSRLRAIAKMNDLTLLYGAKNTKINQAIVLRDVLLFKS
ncbi:MAG: DUF488 domain-containing protein [Bacteroidetes bacterium HGW-Bacteroidetes-3]|nr:MAG: DUF488 domain-containing protein [Bacteroidetes bacterium HGW-Bacteroidetes-3]